MKSPDKASAKDLALAFLRKTATKTRFSPTVMRCVETDACWIFDFYHPRWRDLRSRGEVFGTRVAVYKKSRRPEHYAILREKETA